MNRSRATGLLGAVLACAMMIWLTGCQSDEPSADPTVPVDNPSITPTPSVSASPSPTAPPAQSSTSAAPLPADAAATDRLLAPAELPGFNDEWTWAAGTTGPLAPKNFGRCAKFDVLSIGALEGAQRTYVEAAAPESTNRAAMQVIDFADAKTAERASRVLDSWHADCTTRIRAKLKPELTGIDDVPVSAGSGSWYLLTTLIPGQPDDAHFHAFGKAVNGARMALLTIDNDGQDRNYELGLDPMEVAVAAAAARLG